MKNFLICSALLVSFLSVNQIHSQSIYSSANVDFDSYQTLVAEVNEHRKSRLVDLNSFLELAKSEDVIILDARSERMYLRKHIKGAVNLNFSEFTQETLAELIPSYETKILIYCNNNFDDDAINFPTKMFIPDEISSNQSSLMLALNVPTYINLYGYGYRNIYELSELVSVRDLRLEFEGTDIETAMR